MRSVSDRRGRADISGQRPRSRGSIRPSGRTLLARGRARGVLHADEITHVLRQVELSGDVLAAVHGRARGDRSGIDDRRRPGRRGRRRARSTTDARRRRRHRSVAEDDPAVDDRRADRADGADRRRRADAVVGRGAQGCSPAPSRAARAQHRARRRRRGTSDTVRMYLKEIGRVELLSARRRAPPRAGDRATATAPRRSSTGPTSTPPSTAG